MPLPFPPEVGAAAPRRLGSAPLAAARSARGALPRARSRCLPVRDALFVPRALGPIHVGSALVARRHRRRALAHPAHPRGLRAAQPGGRGAHARRRLHPVGCEAYVYARVPDGERAWIVLEGIRWIALEVLETAPGGQLVARVKPCARRAGRSRRGRARSPRRSAPTSAASRPRFPDGERLVAIVDARGARARSRDLVIANLPVPVDDKARYAEEPRLVERLRLVSRLAGLGSTR